MPAPLVPDTVQKRFALTELFINLQVNIRKQLCASHECHIEHAWHLVAVEFPCVEDVLLHSEAEPVQKQGTIWTLCCVNGSCLAAWLPLVNLQGFAQLPALLHKPWG